MVRLTGKDLTVEQIVAIVRGERVSLAPAALMRAERSHRRLHKAARTQVIYGVNTGFGPMADRMVGAGELAELQRNLIVSHACGGGEPVGDDYVFAAMTVRLNTLLRGDSGVSRALLERLGACINARLAPIIPERGGVGASGDLIQLAHMALMLIGEGEVRLRGKRMPARTALTRIGCAPLELGPKEGLALINGTSFMTGVAALALNEAWGILGAFVRASALALEAAGGFEDALHPYLHAVRPHPGQGKVAERMRELLRGSKLLRSREAFRRRSPGERTRSLERSAQDVYSLRCVPQIAGPILESLRRTQNVVSIELNATTDNPIVGPAGEFIHGGNFHGEYIAAAMDDLKRSLAKLSMLSERRLNYFLHSKINGLYPPFLSAGTPGLTLGLQGLQFTATSTVALNQTLSYPASLHSIPSNGDNQDVVSMGADAALLCAQVARQSGLVVAIELVALRQLFHLSGASARLSGEGRVLLRSLSRRILPIVGDRPLYGDIEKLAAAVRRGEFVVEL